MSIVECNTEKVYVCGEKTVLLGKWVGSEFDSRLTFSTVDVRRPDGYVGIPEVT